MQKEMSSSDASDTTQEFFLCQWLFKFTNGDKKKCTILIGIVSVFVFVIFNIVVYRIGILYGKKMLGKNDTSFNIVTTLTPTPTPLPLICKGIYEFSVSSKGNGGFVRRGVLTPCDPQRGSVQKLQIVANGTTMQKMEIELVTDGKKQSIPLEQHGEQKDTWECSWNMDDTYDYTYALIIKGMQNGEEVQLPLVFR